ncbi:HD-GYP domain-containing protein [Deinococcus koreensis]|nr:HD-GYP domain-containing protein [Deinococcus koreensis]
MTSTALPAPPDLASAFQDVRTALHAGDPAHLDRCWDEVLQALCTVLPGVQRASLAIRSGSHFSVRAVAGYPVHLRGLALPTYTERAWYGQGDDLWRRGVPRSLEGEALHAHLAAIERMFPPLAHFETLRAQASLAELRWNVLLPIALDGQVRAHLNLDGFTPHGRPPSLPPALGTWLGSLLEEAQAQAPGLLEEHHALRVIAHLGETLRPIQDPELLLTTGLHETVSGFGAADAFISDGLHLDVLGRRLRVPAPADEQGLAEVLGTLGFASPSTISEVCGPRLIGLIWTGPPRPQPLASTALRGVAERVHYATIRATEEVRLRAARNHALEMVGVVLEARDLETRGHTQRVAGLAGRLGEALRLPPDLLEALHLGALLHDLGKIALPDQVLLKSGALNEAEWTWIRRHPQLGYDLAARLPSLPAEALDVILHHHERWDGSGYPHGLAHDRIGYLARLFSVVDTYDALTSVRPYKAAWSPQQAREELRSQSGRQFDPQAVAAFLTLDLDAE